MIRRDDTQVDRSLKDRSRIGKIGPHKSHRNEESQVAGRNDEKTALVNGPALIEARKARGYLKRSQLAAVLEARGILSRDALEKWERSPDKPHRALWQGLALVAEFLTVPLEWLVVRDGPIPPPRRNCAGEWHARGYDIIVPGHFDYPNGPKFFEADVVVKVHGGALTAEGLDHDKDFLSFFGHLREDGNFIVGNYTVANERLHAYGTVNLRFESCGNRITGFYVGRETGHGSTFILGNMVMDRIKKSDPPPSNPA
jgi:hypothetical protein